MEKRASSSAARDPVLLFPLTFALALGVQSPPADRRQAEAMARAGQNEAAIKLFERIVEIDPADTEARLWIARLKMRLGRADDAEAEYRSVLREHPADVDARVGLGVALTRNGAWQEAIALLTETEKAAGDNADLFAALARAYRRGGDDRRALEYFDRARALAPADPDIVLGYETVARAYGHWLSFEGYGQGGAPGADVRSGWLMADVRVTPRLHVQAAARSQHGSGYADVLGGGGIVWRAGRSTSVAARATGGSGNVALPSRDVSADVVEYLGLFEFGGGIRSLSFAGAGVIAGSATLGWSPTDRWRLDVRYTLSRSSFDATNQSSLDHSVLLRDTWQAWRRVALIGSYAYGIESFENLTADRLGALGTKTLGAGARVDLSSLTRVALNADYEWRSNDTRVTRITVALVQWIR